MIRVEGLRKSFGDVRAVDGVDLQVERGELLVLLGQNGAGKSTTLRCLGGILKPDAGLIELDGLRLPEKLDAVRARLGVVPDQARLYGRNTAPEYLDRFGYLYGVPEPVRRKKIAYLLERFDLADRADTVLAAYSRGMAQKVALIRATLHDPDWIFCDEPTAGLDPVAAADMRHYLAEQKERGAALIVTTHVLSEADLMADRIAIMRKGVIVTRGTLEDLRQEAAKGRRLSAHLSKPVADPEPLNAWLGEHAVEHTLAGDRLTYTLPWSASVSDRAAFAAELQRRLSSQDAPFHELEEEETSLESVYLKAMEEPVSPSSEPMPAPAAVSGIGAPRMFASLGSQWNLLRHSLPFYVSSWWRRGDLSWVMYLNAFVLLLVAGTSLFGQLPGVAGQVAERFAGGTALQAGLLLPLFFMSFALLESIKSSIGIWWEKAQQSLEVLLYTPIDDPSLIWLEVLPGAVVSTVWVTFWMAAGMTLLTLFGQSAPWDLLPIFAFVAAVTAYWAAMGRMLGFMLFPREGAAGGAWSFLLSPVSAAVADLPLALFVFRSPLAPPSLLLPITACFALTVLCGTTFDRERLMETGLGRTRKRRVWLPVALIRRNAAAIAAGLLLALAPAAIAATVSSNAHWHSWSDVQTIGLSASVDNTPFIATPVSSNVPATSGVTVAAAALAGIVAMLALMLGLVALSFAAFFLLGVPALLGLIAASAAWGIQLGFGGSTPLQPWLVGAGGIALLALALNTGAALPIYWSLIFGSGRRLDRLREAWSGYWSLFRGLVLPACALFGIVVFRLLAAG
ncbi:MAG TPA: ABC transporter ATP-binding protein [Candidatus Dormibacteraeota bacterium]